jgi:RNA polymerase sigma-70 factor (ECF subfamily)
MTTACSRTGWPAASPRRAAAAEALSDDVLIRRIVYADQRAMRMLFARHRIAIYRWLVRLVGDEGLAEDLLSDVFFDVWRKARSFEGRSSVSTWLLAIARHKALSARRRTQVERAIELDDELAWTMADPADNPELLLEKKDREQLLRRSLARLSPEHGEVLDLTYYHGKSIKEIAEIVGINEATVKSRTFYARKRLAQLVAATASPASHRLMSGSRHT